MQHDVTRRLTELAEIRAKSGTPSTFGLSDVIVRQFLECDPNLGRAIDEAHRVVLGLEGEEAELLALDEKELTTRLQDSYMNFYPSDTVTPYVAVAARGSWIVTSHGGVIHESGGYGMLGLGHAPDALLARLAEPWPMANVMTPSFSQKRFADRMRSHIGLGRECPFDRFACLNSGSEAVALTIRIVDLHTRKQTDADGPSHGRQLKLLALSNGFHGRTDGAARLSHSTHAAYAQNLASFRGNGKVEFVPPNDIEAVERAFAVADRENVYFEAMYMEPVMGEGAPGKAITREFYDAARRLTRQRGSMLVVDSIQAGLRAHGCLSIVDYPGFEDCDPPDMETYSKAINAGQFPLSVVALRAEAAEFYVKGTYGNTMTTNPRALELGCAVLDSVDDDLRENIRARGRELRAKLERLAHGFPDAIRSVEGTGLLVCAELDPERYPVTGEGGVEQYLRRRGIQVIHGGHNGLRLTPCFAVGSDEIELIVGAIEVAIREFG